MRAPSLLSTEEPQCGHRALDDIGYVGCISTNGDPIDNQLPLVMDDHDLRSPNGRMIDLPSRRSLESFEQDKLEGGKKQTGYAGSAVVRIPETRRKFAHDGMTASRSSCWSPAVADGRQGMQCFESRGDQHQKVTPGQSEDTDGERCVNASGATAGNTKPEHLFLKDGFQPPPIVSVKRDLSGGCEAGQSQPGLQDEQDRVTEMEEEASDSSSSEDENYNPSIKTDHFGFFVTSERRGVDLPPQAARTRRLKERRRTEKWLTMIDNFEEWRNGRKARRFLRRVRKGIPDCVRGKVWQMMMGSMSMMDSEPNRYAELLASDLAVEGPIEEDIPRTMYDHELFCRKSRVDGREMLRRVLTAYGRHDREVQYCQGMNYICALFLLYMPEENAFWLLVASMQRPCAPLRELFLPGMMKAQEFQYVVDSLAEKHCRKLSAQILANNLTPAMYATQWFLTAFTQRFPYELVTRVWDMFLLEDWKVFYRVCLALFKSVEEEANNLDLENLNVLLRNMPPKADAHKILKIAASLPLKHRHIEKRNALFYGRSADA